MKQWTLLTAAGLALGLTAGVLAGIPLGQVLNAMIVTALVVSIAGAILGAFQAFGLPARRAWWIAATTAGAAIGLALGVVTVEQVGKFITGTPPRIALLSTSMRALSFVALGLIAGTTLGLAQWLVLRIRHWAVICGAALGVAFSVASLLLNGSVPGRIAFVVVAGLMFGAMTSWPLRRTRVTT
jgi:hypothetical protein